MTEIPFRDLPGQPRLFLDFLDSSPAATAFLPAPRDPDAWRERARKVAARCSHRKELASQLARQNRFWENDGAALEALQRLEDPDTVAVVTGQQAGFLGGPLLTVWKALSVLRIAEEMNASGIPTIPVFWIQTEDHDYAEASEFWMLDSDDQLHSLIYQAEAPSAKGAVVGRLALGSGTSQAHDRLQALLPEGPFKEALLKSLFEAFAPGRAWGDGFARWMAGLLGKRGLVLLDPLDPALKRLAGDVAARALSRSDELAALLGENDRRLEAAGYPLQVRLTAGHSLLFYLQENLRIPIRRKDGCFEINGEIRDRSQLVREADEHPDRFSPNVLLRPVVQDWILPCLAYVGGPAEVAYFPQLRPLHAFFDLEEPVIVPRNGLTLVPARIHRLLEKYGWSLGDFWGDSDAVFRRLMEDFLYRDLSAKFRETEKLFRDRLSELEQALEKLDPTLAGAVSTSEKKILYQLGKIEHRFLQNHSQKAEIARSHVRRVENLLFPGSRLQERVLNAVYFLGGHGYNFLDRAYEAMEPWPSAHKVLFL
ncbi:MAG: bacillithiol biosynthesis cysteine-adding enzyme BshC [Acidobacteria bacterium]|nr:bacillithiol biosynthesis cysteine-adding enzyme BshC [Acidobacteriota bacterium]